MKRAQDNWNRNPSQIGWRLNFSFARITVYLLFSDLATNTYNSHIHKWSPSSSHPFIHAQCVACDNRHNLSPSQTQGTPCVSRSTCLNRFWLFNSIISHDNKPIKMYVWVESGVSVSVPLPLVIWNGDNGYMLSFHAAYNRTLEFKVCASRKIDDEWFGSAVNKYLSSLASPLKLLRDSEADSKICFQLTHTKRDEINLRRIQRSTILTSCAIQFTCPAVY